MVRLKRICAFLFALGLLIVLFGAVLISAVHELSHLACTSSHMVGHSDSTAHEHYHSHGHGQHSHGSTLTVLLKTVESVKLSELLRDVPGALLYVMHIPGIFDTHQVSLDGHLPIVLESAVALQGGFLNSTPLEVPTPPPKNAA